MFLSIGGFFLIVNGIGYGHVTGLRVVNILFVILFSSLLAKSNWMSDQGIEYVSNFLSIITANIINVVLCMIGFVVYTSLIEPDYLDTISRGLLWSPENSIAQILIALFFEGVAGGVVVSFTVMQYWKNKKRQHRTIF